MYERRLWWRDPPPVRAIMPGRETTIILAPPLLVGRSEIKDGLFRLDAALGIADADLLDAEDQAG
jgi:hypothetical protein